MFWFQTVRNVLARLLSGLMLFWIVCCGVTAAADPPSAAGEGVPARVTDPAVTSKELEIRLLPLTVTESRAVAEAWQGIVKAKSQEIAEAQVAILNNQGAIAADARRIMAALIEERRDLLRNYAIAVSGWEKKGGNKDEIATARAYANTILIEQTRTSDLDSLWIQARNWTTDADGGLAFAVKSAVVIAALAGLLLLARLVRSASRRGLRRIPHLSRVLEAFLLTGIYWLTVAIGLLIVLSALGIDITPLFALLGGAAFVMAFALQDSLGNLASGMMIMLNRPFDVGDFITAGGVSGTVRSVSIVSTTVVTGDNQVIIIPNKSVWGSVITNVNASATRRIDLVFGIGYGDSIERAQRALEDVVASHPLVLKDPAPVIRVHALADSAVNFICRPWVETANYGPVASELQRQIKERFDAEGITIPFPQRDVHLHRQPPTPKSLDKTGGQ